MEKCQDNCGTPMKETQVNAQLEFLNNSILDNDSIVRELMNRLNIVTVQEEPEEPSTNKLEVRQSLVVHAEAIRSFGERLVCLTNDVRSMLNRLEL